MTKNLTTGKSLKFWQVLLTVCLALFFTFPMYAQGVHVSGQVLDGNEPLAGATVVEKGTNNATMTDADGRYSLTVGANAVLSVSYIGYRTAEERVNGRKNVVFLMQVESNELDEVVAIGYGVQKKKLVTGATVQVKGDDLVKLNTVSPLGALQSKAPGVNIVKNSGKPGDGFKVNIRGLGTIYNSSPLYIIDGVPNGDINLLNPNDIESIDVLKDAASAAIYGARAANGVILITTKQGKKGKPDIQYDFYYGWQSIPKTVTPLNAQQYVEMLGRTGLTDDEIAAAVPMWDQIQSGEWTGTNWLDAMKNDNAGQQSLSFHRRR